MPNPAYLDALGIQCWVRRSLDAEPAHTTPTVTASPPVMPLPSPSARLAPPPVQAIQHTPTALTDWDSLQQRVAQCTACQLSATRTQTVLGVGNRQADLMLIGEAPGEQEDLQGEPFVGRAGQLLNAMLAALGMSREAVYIANVVKCRPPRNRNPQVDEMQACAAFLEAQIHLIQPRLLVALGAVAARHLLQSTSSLARLRTSIHSYHNTPLLITYHPAYLLRAPAEKAKAWQDLKQIAKTMQTWSSIA